eukprot:CAMPEP_0181026604 /NCGR_PEP_ID=MMETSP1070-20121207/3729_1 /TAXON_ID=265543 /ORGANISM="Minutocellus polymorphus, Strain NH13" /LENGTH=287 /DNA_ID=CAMNT_0023103809 /DNA_START=166 /DNA_END=1029 /DNA_ORIENTATION=-
MTARRRRLRPDDPFLAAGNEIALRDAFTQVFFYTMDHKESSSYDAMRPNLYMYPCSAHGCHQAFESLEECDSHYFNTHTRECGQCRAVLPNDHLLDLHISEAHDWYFATALQRGKASFACLVAACKSSFECERARHRHLMEAHLYPRWFRFHPRRNVVGGNILQNDKGRRGQKSRNGGRRGGKGKKGSNTSELDTTRIGTKTDESYEERKQKQLEKKKARKEKQKAARALIPCKFHLMQGGCERGDRCDFLHSSADPGDESTSSNVPASNSDADMAIDALSNQLECS